jgi:hypothetical protein
MTGAAGSIRNSEDQRPFFDRCIAEIASVGDVVFGINN